MPRTGRISQRETEPDPIFANQSVTKLINTVMRQGKKTIAQRHVYTALKLVKDKTGKDPLEVFEVAVRNVTPQMEVRSRRVGGAAYQVPAPIRGKRSLSLAMRWLVRGAKERSNKEYHTFSEKLAAELIDAANGEGAAFQRKITAHKMADANKAFAHFRW
ncbi:MAG: 30S ribosomal protein S7 [Candidatus Chisholmbacteria bacterium RIFCSPHIGHO2_01_FULL_49_18]|jgi:small subunit ribosomal protein S7|uniref:Small ribosomal subunit protein uS7 n=2 Tax=Candidatus Chisholmiibacteriota TaxID=1817900 RepID=A0A1G1VLS4_9BACT|nr:MAG: 30S ribosomal protein S7 [Candidatus Chisholmbacteria bacterium RIFCSPHIGHO2_01_FULL_49_18]OGY19368.1 MAG: 30S ribosomal protein S7 [Candidatus Chisholmbacteria bacterium RIFCSPLOWO2_01_FULL_49_14]